MSIIRIVQPGECLPKWYGVLEYDRATHYVRAAPLGLNLVLFALMRLRDFVTTLPYDVPADPRSAFRAGLEASEAFEQGRRFERGPAYQDGYRQGFRNGQQARPDYQQTYELGAQDATQAHEASAALKALYSRPVPLDPATHNLNG